MNIFCDYHHGGLYKSLKVLLEDRLGHKLYRPIGLDWFDEGYWKIAEPYNNAPETIGQFLGINHLGFDKMKNLNGNHYVEDEIYYVRDINEKIYHKGITLKKFKEMQFDVVISSYQPHDYPYEDLVKKYQPKAKLVAQIGNINQGTHIKNVMASSLEFYPQEGQRVIYYHQEFDTEVYKYLEPKPSNKITSFVNLLPEPQVFDEYKNSLPEYNFKAYGSCCPDGNMGTPEGIAQEMADSLFGWHIKPGGDGFGHVIHNWFACGRPVILWKSPYFGKMAESLMEDGITCINLEEHNKQENINLIRKYSEPEEYIKLCQNVLHRFKEIVDFDREAGEMRNFLNNLI